MKTRKWTSGEIPDKYIGSFWKRVDMGPNDECWNWKTYKANGYGIFYYGRNGYQIASRVSWYLHNGIIPDKMLICHYCDNPSCVNPSHLFLGTYYDNTQDMIKKNRHKFDNPIFGEGNGNSKLIWKDIIAIKKIWNKTERKWGLKSKLSRDFSVDRNIITGIIQNDLWKEENFIVSEIYDTLTFQGEGPTVGRICTFIRLGRCNQHCVWCDSQFTWRFTDRFPHVSNQIYDEKEELSLMSTGEIIEKLKELKFIPPMIVISGGEPMLQYKVLPNLIRNLNDSFCKYLRRIEIETAGTIFDKTVALMDNVYFNVSPKLESSGNPKSLRYKPDALRWFEYCNKAIFKFVICDQKDLDEIDEIIHDVEIPDSKIYVMVEGITKEKQDENLRKFLPEVLRRNWNITPRLQIQLFGNKRGV